jgi:hypothetical protein
MKAFADLLAVEAFQSKIETDDAFVYLSLGCSRDL